MTSTLTPDGKVCVEHLQALANCVDDLNGVGADLPPHVENDSGLAFVIGEGAALGHAVFGVADVANADRRAADVLDDDVCRTLRLLATRPSVRTPSSVGPRTMRPPGASTFSVTMARSMSCATKVVRVQLVQVEKNVDLPRRARRRDRRRRRRRRFPARGGSACRRSRSAREPGALPLTASVMIVIGVRVRLRHRRRQNVRRQLAHRRRNFLANIFRRFADVALQHERDDDVARCPRDHARDISSMPLTEAIDSSSGRMTCETTSSGLAPGSRMRTFTVAGSASGNRSTPRSTKLKTPRTTRNMISMNAKTGRLTQISERDKDHLLNAH